MEVYDGAHALGKLVRESDEYKAYAQLKERATEDETSAALIKEYKRLQTSLQLAAVAGGHLSEEDTRRFSQMSGLMYASPEISGYLLAEMRLQRMMADVFKILSDAADMNLPGVE